MESVGLSRVEHPFVGAGVDLGDGRGWVFTGRLSLDEHGWLVDHAVAGTVLFPGTGFIEWAFAVGVRVGAEVVEELTVLAPLVLAGHGGVQMQLTVGEADTQGRRTFDIYSRPERPSGTEAGQQQWTHHASGALISTDTGGQQYSESLGSVWPPAGAEPVEIGSLYERLAGTGVVYGPAFQGLRAAWRHGEEVFAEVEMDEERTEQSRRFGVHPALLDAAFHAALDVLGVEGEPGRVPLPFSWSGVGVWAPGASRLRVRVVAAGPDAYRLTAWDESGEPVVSVDTLTARAVDVAELEAARGAHESLYRLDWQQLRTETDADELRIAVIGDTDQVEISADRHADLAALLDALEQGAPVPDVVVAPVTGASVGGGLVSVVKANTYRVLGLLQAWLAEPRFESARLVVLTEGALTAGAGEVPDLAVAPVAGLVRSAAAEHPGRFAMVDLDGADSSRQVLAEVLRISDEPELAVRGGSVLVPRLTRAQAAGFEGTRQSRQRIDPESTVLITGGTGGLGAVLARHLVAEHGSRHLLLVSRRGPDAEGARELQAELAESGCRAELVACDIADRDSVAEVLDSIPVEHPLAAVFHLAGVIEDGPIESLERDQVEKVLRPKLDAAWHLHELTASSGLVEFTVFSSAAPLLGGPGQGNYAVANAFLDALAAYRVAGGSPAMSLAWGLWAATGGGGMHEQLTGADRVRVERQIRARLGLVPIPAQHGMELLDLARRHQDSLLVPMLVDTAAWQAQARTGVVPAAARNLVPAVVRDQRSGSLARRLAGVAETEWDTLLLAEVRTHVAAVLGHDSAHDIGSDRAFKELGFDSLGAVDLRNRLSKATGLTLPATLVFDHPTPTAVATYLKTHI
ncbi:type I polyketide synthase, partial [Nocardia sp. NPDC005745]|uniref:type I polyketide synthase n=1 Tax=Nocardia sp. NPDC005745 TaxID=3157061 RepID=UPI0033CA6F2A